MVCTISYIIKNKDQRLSTVSEVEEVKEALRFAHWLLHKNLADEIIITDNFGERWTVKQLEKYFAQQADRISSFEAYFDGSYDVQTRRSGCGIVIYLFAGKTVTRIRRSVYLGLLERSSDAEFLGMQLIFRTLHEEQLTHLDGWIFGDNKGVIESMLGNYPVYEQTSIAIIEETERLIKKNALRVGYESIGRNDNKEAHNLAKQGMAEEILFSKNEEVLYKKRGHQ
ncbi:MAG: reverse transcriptase-like protein [Bacilli bacterium]